MACEILDHSDMETPIDKEHQDKLKVIHNLIKEVHEHCCSENGDDKEEEDDEDEDENEDMKESLASTAPPYGQVTQRDILVRRGVLKKKGGKHVLAKEERYNDALVNKTVSYVTKMKTFSEKKDDPCWDSHERVGMKMKNGKKVPNCVPKDK
jgi:hypothetical protein